MNWLIWPPLALVLFAYLWLRHTGYSDAAALTIFGTLLPSWMVTCGAAAVLRSRAPGLALTLALLWLLVSLIALIVVSVVTFEASGI